jgi:glucan endo-1,3-beta-D-glucosidase
MSSVVPTMLPSKVSSGCNTSLRLSLALTLHLAIKAAIDTKTNLLLGVWASAGQAAVDNEIIALKQAVSNWGPALKTRVVGISVGSEDLYRSSAQGQANNAGVGATSAQIVKYIKQVRAALKGTPLEGVRVGHVDTWTAWELPENAAVVNAVDWLGHNSFPYFETTKNNPIGQGKNLFFEGLSHTEGASKGKPVRY